MDDLLLVPKALSERDAAKYLGISSISLRQGRCEGRRDNRMPPPPFLKIGRKILYLRDDLDQWLESFRVTP